MDEEEPEYDWNGGLLPHSKQHYRKREEQSEQKRRAYGKTLLETRSQVDDYFSGILIYIPEDLRDYCLGIKEYPDRNGRIVKRRIEFKEGLIILWSIIHSGYYDNNEDSWKFVHNENLFPVFNDDSKTLEAKNCLKDGNFLEDDGSWQEGVESLGYKTHYEGKIVPYHIKSPSKRLEKVLTAQKPDCKLFQDRPDLLLQRQSLDKISVNVDIAKDIAVRCITAWNHGVDLRADYTTGRQLSYLSAGETLTARQQEIKESHARKIEKRTKKLRKILAKENIDKEEQQKIEEQIKEIELSPMSDSEKLSTFTLGVMKMNWRKGRITTGHKSGRIFSPLTQLARDFRQSLRWNIEGLSGRWELLDLICSQPTLIAYTSGDEQMIKDCLKNKYYDRIKDILGQSRDEAKVSFCEYAYGQNRGKLTAKNINSWAVQNKVMKEFYPTAYKYIWHGKQGDHRRFIQRLQQKESEIFINLIMPQVNRRQIPAVTIHDGIFCPAEYGDAVYDLARETLTNLPEKIEQDLSRKTGPDFLNDAPQPEPANK